MGLIEKYASFLPKIESKYVISLQEGNTPLIPARFLNSLNGLEGINIYYKFDGLNPTGSFKDRGMTVAISKLVGEGCNTVICASTGNTSASAAAFSARAGIRCIVLIPEGKIAKGKLLQAYRYGAKVIMVKGNFDDALRIAKEISQKFNIGLVNSLNPYRIEGQKTAAFEIIDELKDAPDYHVLPVGNAGNITAYWKGFNEYYSMGKSNKLPKMIGFQAEGAAPIVFNKVFSNPETIATAIRIGNPASWQQAIKARDESKGLIDSVSDTEIRQAYELLAQKEGIFVEPASAAGVAGVIKLANKGYFIKGSTIVITLTGNGIKDPDFASSFNDDFEIVDCNIDKIMEVIQRYGNKRY